MPVLHVVTDLKMNRCSLPGIADYLTLRSRSIKMLHVIPIRTEHTVIAQTISSPTGSASSGIFRLTADQHNERRVRKIFEIHIRDASLVLFCRIVSAAEFFRIFAASGVPFAPAPDGPDIHMINIGGPCITLSKRPQKFFLFFQEYGIVVIRH